PGHAERLPDLAPRPAHLPTERDEVLDEVATRPLELRAELRPGRDEIDPATRAAPSVDLPIQLLEVRRGHARPVKVEERRLVNDTEGTDDVPGGEGEADGEERPGASGPAKRGDDPDALARAQDRVAVDPAGDGGTE